MLCSNDGILVESYRPTSDKKDICSVVIIIWTVRVGDNSLCIDLVFAPPISMLHGGIHICVSLKIVRCMVVFGSGDSRSLSAFIEVGL